MVGLHRRVCVCVCASVVCVVCITVLHGSQLEAKSRPTRSTACLCVFASVVAYIAYVGNHSLRSLLARPQSWWSQQQRLYIGANAHTHNYTHTHAHLNNQVHKQTSKRKQANTNKQTQTNKQTKRHMESKKNYIFL